MTTEQRITKLEKKVKAFSHRIAIQNEKLRDILSNQKHYLRYRATTVNDRHKIMMKTIKRYYNIMQRVPKLAVMLNRRSHSGKDRHILLVTGNQARKLRMLAECDLRPILNSKANHKAKTRVRLCGAASNEGYKTV